MGRDENHVRALTPSSCREQGYARKVARPEVRSRKRDWSQFVGCLPARRRNGPKQAGLSNQCPHAEWMGIDDESDQVP